MTRAGSTAADVAAGAVFVAWLIGIVLAAPGELSWLAAATLVFAVSASWAVTYVVVGLVVDVWTIKRGNRGRPRSR